MTIKWIGCHDNNFLKGRDGKTVKYVILHWIVGTLESADATFAKADRIASAHYGIGDGDIHQYVQESDTAYHCGLLTMNKESIGIEHEGGPDLPISEATIQTSIELVTDICKRYSIPADREHIKKHSEIKATACPGTLPIDRIVAEVANRLATPPPAVDPDKVKVDLGGDLGMMEVQAIRSVILDLRRDIKNEQDKLNGFVSKWITEWNLDPNSSIVGIEVEMSKLLPLEDRFAEYRNAIEEAVGAFDDDYALLIALSAVKIEIKSKSDQIAELQQKLKDANISGYKYVKSWDIYSLRFKLYKKEG